MEKIIETERIFLRKLNFEDFYKLSEILKDIEVMYAWEHSFSDGEIKEWIENNIRKYGEDKTGYLAVIDKKTKDFVGQAGIHYSIVNNKKILEI